MKTEENYVGTYVFFFYKYGKFCRNKKLSANVSFLKIESAAKVVLKVINKNKY